MNRFHRDHWRRPVSLGNKIDALPNAGCPILRGTIAKGGINNAAAHYLRP
jgi:hypothetical protein